MRITKHRRLIYDLIKTNQSPLSAENIAKLLPEKSMDLSTIYRSLDALLVNNLISKTMISNTAYYFLKDKHHHHFIICLRCKKMVELDCHISNMINSVQSETDFQITQHDLTFYGYCKDCQTLNSL